MERTDEVGAIAAAEYFMELYEYTLAAADVSRWEQVAGQSCDFCSAVREDVERLRESGNYYDGGALTFHDVRATDFRTDVGSYILELNYSVEEAVEVDEAGSTVAEIAPEEGTLVLELIPSARGWVLHGAQALSIDGA